MRVPTLQLVKNVDNKYATAEVTGLGADQWTLAGGAGAYTATGNGTTGGPTVVRTGNNDLSEATANPAGAGYEVGQWSYGQAPGTVGEDYPSSLNGTMTDGWAQLQMCGTDRVLCTIMNTARPGSLTWNKASSDGITPLAGITWILTGSSVPHDTTIEDCTAGPCPAWPYKDQDPAPGSFAIKDLKWGTYTVRKTDAPVGYQVSLQAYTFPQIAPASLEATLNTAIVNEREIGSLTQKKVDASSTAIALEGSEWTISGSALPGAATIMDYKAASAAQRPKPAGTTYYDSGPAVGFFAVTGLPWGDTTYASTEKKAPVGYRLDATPRPFTITKDALDHAFASITSDKQGIPAIPLTGGFGVGTYVIDGIVTDLDATGAATAIKRRKARTA